MLRLSVALGAWLAFAPMPASAADADDALRIDQLRQDVLDLQRHLREQARRIERLEQLLARERRAGAARTTGDEDEAARLAEPPPWLAVEKWRRIERGMTEPEAVAILGTPTALRADPAGTRTLFYSMELPAGGFLSGRIVVERGRVAEISTPALR